MFLKIIHPTRGYGVLAVFVLLLTFSAVPAEAEAETNGEADADSGKGAGFELAGPPLCSAMDCKFRVLSPAVRIAVTELLMVAGLMVIFPDELDPRAVEANKEQFVRSWTQPPNFDTRARIFESDGDPWAFNVFAHGLFGSETYLAARGWGHSPPIAVLFSIISSMVWEYVIESWSQQPSMIDMFWTPLGGSLFGELRYQAYMAAKRGIPYKGLRIALMIILDPIGELERLIVGCQR